MNFPIENITDSIFAHRAIYVIAIYEEALADNELFLVCIETEFSGKFNLILHKARTWFVVEIS